MVLTEKDVVLFSGDSITHGGRGQKMDCNHILGHGYQFIAAGELALKYAAERPKFINKGYSGYTMSRLLETWKEDVLDNNPTVLSILAGVNDGIFGYFNKLTVDEVNRQYEDALSQAICLTKEKVPDVKIMVCEPFYFPLDRSDLSYKFTPHPDCEPEFKRPDSDDTEESQSYRIEAMQGTRKAAKKVAEKYGCTFVPLYDKFEECFKNTKREYFTWDGTHPTVTGHMLIAKEWLKFFEVI